MKRGKIFIILSFLGVVLITTPLFGYLYKKIIGREIIVFSRTFLGYFEGMFMALSFFVPLFLIIFGSKNKYRYLSIFLLYITFLGSGFWEGTATYAITSIASWLIAEIILFIYRKLKRIPNLIEFDKSRLFVFALVCAFSYLTMPFVGEFYSDHISTIGGVWWGPDPEHFTGFILSFLFFGSFLSWLFIEKNKRKIWLWFVLPLLIFLLGDLEEFIVGIGLVIVGWLLAQGILFVVGKLRKSEKSKLL